MAYEKQNFQDGTVLTAGQLNHMEEGIEAIDTALQTQQKAVDAQLQAQDSRVDAALQAQQAQVDAQLRTAGEILQRHTDATAIVCSAGGETVAVADAADYPIQGLTLYGKTSQAGTPSPDAPVDVVNAGSGTIGVTVAGKNLLEVTAESATINGCTLTVNADKTITLNGTAMANFSYPLARLTPTGTFAWSLGVSAGVLNGTYLTSANGDGTYTSFGATEKTFVNKVAARTLDIIVIAGTYSNVTLKPMVCATAAADATYAPYKATQTMAVSTPDGLPGIPVTAGGNYTDESGQAWICDEIDLARGVYVRRVGKRTFIGTETMARTGTYEFFIPLGAASTPYTVSDALCSHFVYTTAAYGSQTTGFVINNGNITLRYMELAEDSIDAFRAFLTAQYDAGAPVTVYYTLAAPVETALSDAQLTAFRALHTNHPNTTVLNDAGAGMALSYVADTKTYIDNQFAQLAAAIVNNT